MADDAATPQVPDDDAPRRPTGEPTFSTPKETVYRQARVVVAERPDGGKALAIVDMTTGHAHVAKMEADGADTVADALRSSGLELARPADLAGLEAPGQ